MEAVRMTNQMTRKACRASARSIRREQVRLRNEPPVLTVGEEVFNAVSHGLGALLAVAAMEAWNVYKNGVFQYTEYSIYVS